MESIKEIFILESNKIVLTIPAPFIAKKIEVFATELEHSPIEDQNPLQPPLIVAEKRVKGYKFNREEANKR